MNKANIAVRPYKTTAPGGMEGITSFSERFNTIAAVNGGFFDTNTGTPYSAVVYPDKVIAKNIQSVNRSGKTYFLTRSFFGIKDTREMSIDWIYHFGNNPIDIYKYDAPIPNAQGNPAPAPSPLDGNPYYELLTGIGGGPTVSKR